MLVLLYLLNNYTKLFCLSSWIFVFFDPSTAKRVFLLWLKPLFTYIRPMTIENLLFEWMNEIEHASVVFTTMPHILHILPTFWWFKAAYQYFWMHMHPYTNLCPPGRLPAWPSAHLSQFAFSKDDINAHPLRPMSYWFSSPSFWPCYNHFYSWMAVSIIRSTHFLQHHYDYYTVKYITSL
jgi:hypothetical protein